MPDPKSRSEEEYFLSRERELLRRLQAKAREEAERKNLAQAVGIENAQILEVLREMGFDRETVVLLGLLPLIQVAWSDGAISPEERAGLLEVSHTKGIEEGSAAHARLVTWLDRRPESTFFERALTIIRDLMSYQTEDQRTASSADLFAACERIASTSGGILGLGAVSSAEREVLRRVAGEIEKAHRDAAERVKDSL